MRYNHTTQSTHPNEITSVGLSYPWEDNPYMPSSSPQAGNNWCSVCCKILTPIWKMVTSCANQLITSYTNWPITSTDHLLLHSTQLTTSCTNPEKKNKPTTSHSWYSLAQDFIRGMLEFYKLFPGMTNNVVYLSGESYAGKYIPFFYDSLVKQNTLRMNIKGLLIGNAMIKPVSYGHTHIVWIEWGQQNHFLIITRRF